MDDKTRIHKLKLALLREGGDKRMDAAERISYLIYEYSDIMAPESSISKEDDLRNMLVELTYYPEFVKEIMEEVYGIIEDEEPIVEDEEPIVEDEEPIVEDEEPVCDQEDE
ncbi:MAG: hypothetical protein WC929_05970 [Bacilli bacterium]